MLLKKLNIAVVSFLLFPVLGLAQITEKHYRIYSTRQQKEVTLQDLVADMDRHDVLFYGEEHNDSVTHFLEHTIFELLSGAHPGKTALSMEMFDRDVQPVMNEYLQGAIREKNFLKDARVWPNYKDYRPMVEYAHTHQLDVICANAPTRYTNLAGRKGQKALQSLSHFAKQALAPLPYDTATGPYYQKLVALTAHDPSGASMGGFNLILSQSLWDATMGWSIASYFKAHRDVKIMQVNGRFHSDEGFAAVAQLKKYAPKIRPLIVSAGPDDSFPNVTWSKFTGSGDYVIVTDPKVPKSY